MDPFHWLSSPTKDQELEFLALERSYRIAMTASTQMTEHVIRRELDHYQQEAIASPVRIGDFIYYRKLDNAADRMTLYRFPYD